MLAALGHARQGKKWWRGGWSEGSLLARPSNRGNGGSSPGEESQGSKTARPGAPATEEALKK
jgi:hypothetical protein